MRTPFMCWSWWPVGLSAVAALGLVGCDDLVRNTPLKPDGPPEVLQVFVRERVTVEKEGGTTELVLEPRLAYGDHPDIGDDDDRDATAAVAGTDQKIRIVVDELMRGNSLEEIECADGMTWSSVPIGTTPDDIAACIGTNLARCTKVCAGIGVLDADKNGGIDHTRMIDGSVGLSCGGVAVPLDAENSFYQPSGNQLIPAGDLGLDGLGPAIVVVPAQSLPTASDCSITLGEAVVDKQGIRPCTRASEDADCNPGDMSAIHFKVEPLQVLSTDPADGSKAVDLTPAGEDATVSVALNGWLDAASVAADGVISLKAGATEVADLEVAVDEEDPASLAITVPGGFVAATTYTLTIGAGIKDTYGAALPTVPAITWTTKAATAARAGH
jgi:hypothetical protein